MKQQSTVERPPMPHVVTLSDRKSLTVSGVSDIGSFDDAAIIVYTDLGELTVRGSNLCIKRLSVESGDLVLEGEIDSLTYANTHSRSGGFFGKLFR